MELHIGDKVHYDDGFKKENGVIKSHSSDLTTVFVVYKCNDDWENYMNYTGQSTKIKDLKEGWI